MSIRYYLLLLSLLSVLFPFNAFALSCQTNFTSGNQYADGAAACAAASLAFNGQSGSLSYLFESQTSTVLRFNCVYSNGALVASGSCAGECPSGTTLDKDTGTCDSDAQPDDCSSDLSTGGKDLSGDGYDGQCGCPSGKELINSFTSQASCADPCLSSQHRNPTSQVCEDNCGNGFSWSDSDQTCKCGGSVGYVNDELTCVPKSGTEADFQAALDQIAENTADAADAANSANNTINNINNTINNISNAASAAAANTAAAAASSAAGAAAAAAGAASSAAGAAASAAAAASLESIDGKLDFTIPSEIPDQELDDVLEGLEFQNNTALAKLNVSRGTLIQNANIFSELLAPRITYAGGCELSAVVFMGNSTSLSFCDYLPMLEKIGNILFIFCNISAFFIYIRVFTSAG